jgi:replicative DNA helicase
MAPNLIENYQAVFLKTFLNFSDFRQLFLSNWKKEYFDTVEDKIIYAIFSGFWLKAKKLPTKKDVIFEITTRTKYIKIRPRAIARIEEIFAVDLAEYTESFVRDQFLDILRRKKLESVIKEIVDEVNKTGNVNASAIKNDIVKSLDIEGDLEDMGIDYYDGDLIQRMKALQESQISHFDTGMDTDLDDVLKLKRKTLVAVSAQLGVGKSLFLNNLAINISQKGHNVLYLSLEMDAYDISKRLDRISMGFLSDTYFKDMDLVDKKMDEMKGELPKRGKLFIRSYSPRSLTAFQIRNILEQYRLKGMGVDVILVDYLTLMKPNKPRKDDNMYNRGKDVAEELSALAKDERCLVFTALQVKSESYGKNKQGSEMVSESLAIPQILDGLVNMVEIIVDEEDKYYVLNFEKTRDSKKTNKRIYLKLQDNLRIVPPTEDEKKKLEELITKKRKQVSGQEDFKVVDLDVL